MLKVFKTEIDPTEEQKIKIRRTIGTCRFVYNFYIAHNAERHENGEKFMSSAAFRLWINKKFKERRSYSKSKYTEAKANGAKTLSTGRQYPN